MLPPSFTDELVKIAEADTQATRENVIRGLKGALAVGAGAGLGTGLGYVAADVVAPRMMQLPPKTRKGIILGMGALGTASMLGRELLKKRYRQYVDSGDKR